MAINLMMIDSLFIYFIPLAIQEWNRFQMQMNVWWVSIYKQWVENVPDEYKQKLC